MFFRVLSCEFDCKRVSECVEDMLSKNKKINTGFRVSSGVFLKRLGFRDLKSKTNIYFRIIKKLKKFKTLRTAKLM